ncbi:unnamed protein product [Durusdinium trenchii]|uniref:TRAF-type domain-containing protein n=1 Tax=Durusdinium trenchii TaxID=1381693 RepID=A0ABP0M7G4_9DINO
MGTPGDSPAEVPVRLGICQGCKAAPFLWATAMWSASKDLVDCASLEWEQVEMRLCPPARHVHGGDELCSSACASTKQKEPVEVERELNVTKELDTEREQCGSDKYFLPKVMGKTPQPEEASAESATSLLYDKLKNIIELLKERLVDRDEVIRMLLLALVTHQNALLLGPPGTGKSHVCKMLASMISDTHKEQGKAFFEAQFHPSTTVEDIFGAISLSGLAENRITRNVRQMLPYASVAFLDEAFKAQSIAFVMLLIRVFVDYVKEGDPLDQIMNTKFGDPGKVDPTLALQDFKLLQQHAKTELRWPADRNGHRFDGDVNPFFWKRRAEYELVLADAKDAKELWSKLQWDEEKQRGAVNTTVPEGGDEFNCQQLQAGWRLLGHNMESLCKELQFDPDNKDKANDCKYEPPVVLTFEGPEVEKVTTYKMLLEFIEYIRKLDANEERAAASKKMTVEGGGRLGDRRLKQIVDVLRIAAVTNNRNSAKGSFVNIPDLYLLVYFCWKTRGDWTLIQAWWLDRIKKELRCLVEDFKKDHKPEGNLWLPDEICRQLQEVWEKGGPQNLDKSQKLQKLEQVMEKRNEIERQRLKDEQRRRQEREQQRKFEDMKAERERQSEKERREDALKEQERKAKAEQDTLDWAQTQEKHAIDKAHREEKMRSIEEREARRKLDEDAKKTEYAQRQEDLRSRAALQLQQKQKEDEKAARCEAEAIELGAEGIRLIKNAEETEENVDKLRKMILGEDSVYGGRMSANKPVSSSGYTPFFIALRSSKHKFASAMMCDIDPGHRDNHRRNALHIVCCMTSGSFDDSAGPALAVQLLEKKVDIKERDGDGATPLLLAAETNRWGTCWALLEHIRRTMGKEEAEAVLAMKDDHDKTGKLQRLSTDAMPCVSAKEALQLASVSNPDEWESLIGSIPALETLSQAEQGIDVDIPETSLDSIDIMKLLQSVRVDLPSSQLHEICDFIGTGQKYDALASQIRVSGQISISAGSQPIQVNVEAKAENFYLHVGDHKVRMTEVKTEMEQAAATCTFTFTCMCYSLSPWLTGDSNGFDVYIPETSVEEVLDVMASACTDLAKLPELRDVILAVSGSQPVQAEAQNFYLHVGDHKVRMTEVKTELEKGFDVYIPETSVEEVLDVMASACTDLAELPELRDVILAVSRACRKHKASRFLMSQLRMSGQISIHAGSQPVQAKAQNFYLHVGDHKVRMTEVKTELEKGFDVYIPETSVEEVLDVMASACTDLAELPELRHVILAVSGACRRHKASQFLMSQLRMSGQISIHAGSQPVQAEAQNFYFHVGDHKVRMTEVKTELEKGFDVYIPETSVEEVLDVMTSACTDLAELPELRDVILAVSSACRKHKASQFLMSQLRMSGQISIHAGSQPVQAKAQNFYFHVGDGKVRMTEVKTELEKGFDVYIPETSVEEVLDVMTSACTDLAELPELRDVILAVSSACRKHKASRFLMSQLRMSGQISIHAGSQPVQAKAQNFYFHVGDHKVKMTEAKTELENGFDVYIPETSVEEVLDVMASACTDLAEFPELRDVILAVSGACRRHKASQFLMSQLRMSGQISIHAGSQPVQAEAQNFYLHVGDHKVRMTEVKTELEKGFDVYIPETSVEEVLDVMASACTDLAELPELRDVILAVSSACRKHKASQFLMSQLRMSGQISIHAGSQPVQAKAQNFYFHVGDHKVRMTEVKTELEKGFDVYIPETSVEEVLDVMTSACTDLAELPELRDVILAVSSACRKHKASQFLMSQLRMSGQISIHAGSQPVQAKAQNFYFHVGDHKVRMTEVKTELEKGFDVYIPETSVEEVLDVMASACTDLAELPELRDVILAVSSACRKHKASQFLMSQLRMSGQISIHAGSQPVQAKAQNFYFHVGDRKVRMTEVKTELKKGFDVDIPKTGVEAALALLASACNQLPELEVISGFIGRGFDIDIPETCVEDFFSLLASACNQLPELEVVSGFTGRVTNVCRKNGFDVDIPKTSVEAALALLASLCDQLPELKAVSDFINTLTSACRKSTAASFLISQICMSGQISVNASKQPIRAKAEKIYLHVGEQKQSLQEVAEALRGNQTLEFQIPKIKAEVLKAMGASARELDLQSAVEHLTHLDNVARKQGHNIWRLIEISGMLVVHPARLRVSYEVCLHLGPAVISVKNLKSSMSIKLPETTMEDFLRSIQGLAVLGFKAVEGVLIDFQRNIQQRVAQRGQSIWKLIWVSGTLSIDFNQGKTMFDVTLRLGPATIDLAGLRTPTLKVSVKVPKTNVDDFLTLVTEQGLQLFGLNDAVKLLRNLKGMVPHEVLTFIGISGTWSIDFNIGNLDFEGAELHLGPAVAVLSSLKAGMAIDFPFGPISLPEATCALAAFTRKLLPVCPVKELNDQLSKLKLSPLDKLLVEGVLSIERSKLFFKKLAMGPLCLEYSLERKCFFLHFDRPVSVDEAKKYMDQTIFKLLPQNSTSCVDDVYKALKSSGGLLSQHIALGEDVVFDAGFSGTLVVRFVGLRILKNFQWTSSLKDFTEGQSLKFALQKEEQAAHRRCFRKDPGYLGWWSLPRAMGHQRGILSLHVLRCNIGFEIWRSAMVLPQQKRCMTLQAQFEKGEFKLQLLCVLKDDGSTLVLMIPQQDSAEDFSMTKCFDGLGIDTIMKAAGITISLNFFSFCRGWRKDSNVFPVSTKKEGLDTAMQLIMKNEKKIQDVLWDMQRVDGAAAKENDASLALSATVCIEDKEFWKVLKVAGRKIDGTLLYSDGSPIIRFSLGECEILKMTAEGDAWIGKEEVVCRLRAELLDLDNVRRGTFECAVKYRVTDHHLNMALKLTGKENNSINLGHWVPLLDWVELYGIAASVDGSIEDTRDTSFTLQGGIRFVFDGKRDEPEGTFEFAIMYAPADLELQAFRGIGVVYLYMDNISFLLLLRGFFKLDKDVLKSLSWVVKWLLPLRTLGLLAKNTSGELTELPGTALKDDIADRRDKICSLLKQREVLPACGKRIYAFQATWKLLCLEASIFAYVELPAEPTTKAKEFTKQVCKPKASSDTDVYAELLATVEPFELVVGNLKVLKVCSASDPNKPMELTIKVGGLNDLYFRLDASIALFPDAGLFSSYFECYIEFLKGEKKQPRLVVYVEVQFFEQLRFKGYVRLTMSKLGSALSKTIADEHARDSLKGQAASAVQKAADMLLVPRAVKANLHLEGDINEVMRSLMAKAAKNILNGIKEGLDAAKKQLDKLKSVPILGGLCELCQWLIKALNFLIDLMGDGVNFLINLANQILGKGVKVHWINVGGEVGGSQGVEAYVSFKITVLGVTITTGLHVNLRSVLEDLAKYFLSLFTGFHGHDKGVEQRSLGYVADDNDSDEESYPDSKPFTAGSIEGDSEYKREAQCPEANLSDKDKEELWKMLREAKQVAVEVGEILDQKKNDDMILLDMPPTPANLDKYKDQFFNPILDTTAQSNNPKVQCALCLKFIPQAEFVEHVQHQCPQRDALQLPCRWCQKLHEMNELYEHEKDCPKRNDPPTHQCDNAGCNADNLGVCLGDDCPECSASGGSAEKRWDCERSHRKECKGLVQCRACSEEMMCKDFLAGHTCRNEEGVDLEPCKECGEMIAKSSAAQEEHKAWCQAQLCTDCEEIVPKFRIERHKQSLCPKRRVKCPGSAEDGPELWANLSVAEEWEVRIDGSCGKSMCRDRLEEHFKKDCTRLAVKCLRCNDTVRGGGRKTYLELLDLHKSKCRQAAKPCPLGCGLKLCEGKMNRHVNKACPNLKMKCKWPGCSLTMSSYEYKDNAATHCGECGDKLDGVGNNMAHIVQDCKKFQPLCPMGCGDRHVFRELKTHLKAGQLSAMSASQDGCRMFWVPCPSRYDQKCIQDPSVSCTQEHRCTPQCSAAGFHVHLGQDLIAHISKCVKLQCPFSDGGCSAPDAAGGIVYNDASKHMQKCEFIKLPCPFRCDTWIPVNEEGKAEHHLLTECSMFKVACPRGCEAKDVAFKDLLPHLATQCPKNVVSCIKGCGAELLKMDEAAHLQTSCQRFWVDCATWRDSKFEENIETEQIPDNSCYRDVLKCDEVHHVTKFHISSSAGRCRPHDFCRRGLTEGNYLPLLTANSLGRLGSLNPEMNLLAKMNFAEERLEQINLETETVQCPQECGEVIDVDEVEHHLKWTCPRNCVSCPFCEVREIPLCEIAKHISTQCEKALVHCRQCGKRDLRRMDECKHISLDCNREKASQCYLCFESVEYNGIEEHLKSSCTEAARRVTCKEVGTFFRTPGEGCEEQMPKRDLLQHWMRDCESCLVSCPLCSQESEEGSRIRGSDYLIHFLSCTKFKVKCPYCAEPVLLKESKTWTDALLQHCFVDCKRFHLPCGWCAENVMWQETADHLCGKCQEFMAPCPMKCREDGKDIEVDADDMEKVKWVRWKDLPLHLFGPEGPSQIVGKCPKYRVRCPYEAQAPEEPPKCTFSTCKEMHDSSIVDGRMPRFRLPHHLEHECAGNVRICRNKNWAEKECEAKVLAKDWEFHQTGSRAAAAQPIQSDDSDVKPCPHRLEQCDKCKGMVPKSDLEDHKKTACTKNKVRCENLGCKEEVVQAGLAYHKKNCLYRKVKAHQGIGSKHGSTKSVNHRPGVKQHPGYYDFTWEGSAQFGPFGGKRNRYHQNRCTSCDKDVGKPANLFKEPGCKQAKGLGLFEECDQG